MVITVLIRLGAALALLAATLLADTSPATAQPKGGPGTTRIFVTIEGVKQGKFKADGGPQSGDRIPALQLSFEVDSPRDLATGQASPNARFSPLTSTGSPSEVPATSRICFAPAILGKCGKEVR